MEKITSKEPVEIKNEPFWTNSTNVLKIESEELQFSSHLINKDTVKREFTQELHNVETKFLNYEVDLPPLKNDDEDIEDYSNLNKETVEIEHEPSWANSTNVLKVESEELQVSSHLISKVPIKKEFKQEFDSIETKFLNHEIDLPALKNEEEIEDYSNEQLTTDANVTGTNHLPSQSSTDPEIPEPCEKLHQCQICLKQFSQIVDLTRHSLIHTDEKHKCQICLKEFSQNIDLIIHSKIHTGGKSYQCKICLKQCLSSSGLKNHNKTHTVDTNIKPYECQICLKRYSYKSDLKAHTEVQQCVRERPYQCQICSKRYMNKRHCTQHYKTHTKPHTCEICFRRFSQKYSLTTHTKRHTGEKPYTCEICFKQFSRENAFTTHTKMHTGGKPYQCQICPKQFFRKNSLTRHSQNHAGTDLVN